MSTLDNLKPLHHYSIENPASIYDEEAMTALELAARTAAKMNETITALLEECRRQNLTISEAVDYMKIHLDDSLHDLLYSMADSGQLDILTEENFEAIRKTLLPTVNVREYGAVGDGVADDTEAVNAAIAAGSTIYFPKGKYKITETLTIPSYKHITGEGVTDTILIYQGVGFLWDIQTNYATQAIIEKMQFTGSADFDNNFLKCSTGKWGASFRLNDFRVLRFSGEVFHIESGFHCHVENGTIMCSGKSVITTFDGTTTSNNFSNCNYFANVFFTKYGEQTPGHIFELYNVRKLTFYSCQLEQCETVFVATGKVEGLTCHSCWFEYVGGLYSFGAEGSTPFFDQCKFIQVEKYNANAEVVDFIKGSQFKIHNGSNRTAIDLRNNNEIIIDRVWGTNENDTYSQNWVPYKFSTQEVFWKLPVNTVTVEKNETAVTAYTLKDITNYAILNGYYDITYICYYSDASVNIYRRRIHTLRGKYFNEETQTVVQSNWGLAKDKTATISMDADTSTVTATASEAPKLSVFTIEYHFNHAKGNL